VTDSVPGIPLRFRERVFEKFFRVEHERPGTTEGVRGAGIGLYLCRQIIEAHGESISAGAAGGGPGTRIAIRLEAQASEGARNGPEANPGGG
jgi:two-component system, NtrC family, sensor histidine kinase KinB